jgi:hypothetical protein
MAEPKTKKTKASVAEFLNAIEDPQKRKDSKTIVKMMKEATGIKPAMWGAGMVGFGNYHYKYASGREGDWFLTGFAPRKQDLTLYIMDGFKSYKPLMKRLGKYKTGKACLYIKRLDDVDVVALRELITRSVKNKKSESA